MGVIAYPFPVEIDLGPVVYAPEIDPDLLRGVERLGRESCKEPISIIITAFVVYIRYLLVVHAEPGLRRTTVVHQGCQNRAGDSGADPSGKVGISHCQMTSVNIYL